MHFERSMVESQYLRDILDQPRALEETVAGLRLSEGLAQIAGNAAEGRFEQIVLTGMGGSYHALQPLYIQLVERGFHTTLIETSELIYYFPALLTPRTLLVIVSQSGRSVEIVRLLDLVAGRLRTIAVTNTPGSPLAKRADVTVTTRAGEEFSVSCKTYLVTLAALEWLGAQLCGRDRDETERALDQAAPAVREYLAGWEGKVSFAAGLLEEVRAVFLTGRGSSLATATMGGLILKESAHFHAEGMSCPAFRHGPLEMTGPDVFVMVFAGDPRTAALNENLLCDIERAGGKAALVGPESGSETYRIPATAAGVRPVLEMLPVQMTSLALAALVGHEPGKFRLLTKVTTIE